MTAISLDFARDDGLEHKNAAANRGWPDPTAAFLRELIA